MIHIAALIAASDTTADARTIANLETSPEVGAVALACPPNMRDVDHQLVIPLASLWDSAGLDHCIEWFLATDASHLLWVLPGAPRIPARSLTRMLQAASSAGAALCYGDFLDEDVAGTVTPHPLIDYQPGSLRDDFDFGPMLLVARQPLEIARADLTDRPPQLEHGGWYDLRLRLCEAGSVLHLPEPLCCRSVLDARRSGEKVFDYVDPRRRDYQLEMEQVATAHLKRIGAWLPPAAEPLLGERAEHPVTASVVIPVRDRVATVMDAVDSALSQHASFEFNVIVVDNHSTDGTGAALAERAEREPRLLHIIPERRDLGIGGCWNEAIYDARCGRYAVQLDSDDLYAGEDVLARIVAELERGPYAMVIGSYSTVDVDLQPLPPGLIDHREWSDDNGRNNALRIHGLGAPRAFHVPTLRATPFPNVSYGEDYAVALQLCRQRPLGRIYESLYWCRRWEGNTDSALPLATHNRFALYKDRLRSLEIAARQLLTGGPA